MGLLHVYNSGHAPVRGSIVGTNILLFPVSKRLLREIGH